MNVAMDEGARPEEHADVPDTAGRFVLGRLADPSASPATGESFSPLVSSGGVVIEAIHSSDYPDPQMYDQDHDEWVVVMDGQARLDVEGRIVVMGPGDWILIGAGVRHRVLSTTQGTRWVAVHLPGSGGSTGQHA